MINQFFGEHSLSEDRCNEMHRLWIFLRKSIEVHHFILKDHLVERQPPFWISFNLYTSSARRFLSTTHLWKCDMWLCYSMTDSVEIVHHVQN